MPNYIAVRRLLCAAVACGAAFSGECTGVHAGVRRHDVSDLFHDALAADSEFDAVGTLDTILPNLETGFCSCTLIAPEYVLTAAHCLTDMQDPFRQPVLDAEFTIDGVTVDVEGWEVHENWDPHAAPGAGFDIAVAKLEQPFTGVQPATRFSGDESLLQGAERTATVVGYGQVGTGLTGQMSGTNGTKRAGHNVLDALGAAVGASQSLVYIDFDHPTDPSFNTLGSDVPLAFEYLPVSGDSGGAWFVEVDGLVQMVGVISFIEAFPGRAEAIGLYGDRAAATRVTLFNDWIHERIGGIHWNNLDDGVYSDGDNWGAGEVPESNDDVRFSIPAHHVVRFTTSPTSRDVVVLNGETQFELDGQTYQITQNLRIGSDEGFGGTLRVGGGGVDVDGQLIVGNRSSGELVVRDGAIVSNLGNGLIGALANSDGMATVTGGGSQWNNASNLHVGGSADGAGGDGSLTVADGGHVGVSDTLKLWSAGSLTLEGGSVAAGSFDRTDGTFDHRDGTLTVSGGTYKQASGQLRLNGTSAAAQPELVLAGGADTVGITSVSVGHGLQGRLTVSGGSLLANSGSAWLGTNSANAVGDATVAGDGSTWTNGGELQVGSFGSGTLEVHSGGNVSNMGNGYLGTFAGSMGTAAVSGDGSTWVNHNQLQVGSHGTGSLTIEQGGSVSNTDIGYLGTFADSMGTALVTDDGSTWINHDELQVGSYGSGNLRIEGGGSVSNEGTGFIGTFADSSGSVTVTGGGSNWMNAGTLHIGNHGSGVLVIENGAAVTNVSGSIGSQAGSEGTVTVNGQGSTWSNGGILSVGIGGSGTLNVLDEGTVSASFGVLVGPNGTVMGDGTVAANVASLGTMAPGASAGTLHVTGNYTQDASASLKVELGGIELGREHDSLQVGGTASLDGALDVSLLDGFMPTAGQTFEILTAMGGISGTFASQLLPSVGAGLFWNLVYGTDSVLLEVAAQQIAGDYNADGVVDAADYIVWRKNGGTQTAYDTWRESFGRSAGQDGWAASSAGGGLPALAAVPEPASLLMLLTGILGTMIRRPLGAACRVHFPPH